MSNEIKSSERLPWRHVNKRMKESRVGRAVTLPTLPAHGYFLNTWSGVNSELEMFQLIGVHLASPRQGSWAVGLRLC